MFRSLITATFTSAVLIAGASIASADPGDYYADGYKSLTRGTGTVSGFNAADSYGEMTAENAAIGASKRGLLGTKTGQSTASVGAYVSDAVAGDEGGDGRYRVTVTFAGAYADEVTAGSGEARGRLLATVFIDEAVIGTGSAELTSTPSQVVLTIEFDRNIVGTPEVAVQAEINATSEATGNGNSADTEAYTSGVLFSLDRVG